MRTVYTVTIAVGDAKDKEATARAIAEAFVTSIRATHRPATC